ncbi:MAG: SNF2 helicase-associated domain-containing protein [Ruminococcus sp.]|jgi:non-specific serine/threonine protein kinase|nr:SNF2 helicase-associated domain-containing protein [Ruminococcus sp.]
MENNDINMKTIAVYDENGFTFQDVFALPEKENKLAKSVPTSSVNIAPALPTKSANIAPALPAKIEKTENPYHTIYKYSFEKNSEFDSSITFLIHIAKTFIKNIASNPDVTVANFFESAENISEIIYNPYAEILMELLHKTPYVIGSEFVNTNWIKHIWEKIADEFTKEIATFGGTIEEFFLEKNKEISVAGRVFFHLVEHKGEDYSFAFLATYATGTRQHLEHRPLKYALKEHENDREELLNLLSTVSRASDKSDLISELAVSGELFSPLMFSPQEAYTFLKEVPIYEQCGITCRIPNFWKKSNKARVAVSIGSSEPSAVGLDAIMAFSPDIYIGDDVFSREEVENLLSETAGLAYLKGKWVEVDNMRFEKMLNRKM